MEIIDLCSDSEDDVKLFSDSEEIVTHLCSEDRKDNLDPIDGFDPSVFLLDTPFPQDDAQQPITLDDDDWSNSNPASCSYRSPAGSSHRIYPLSGSSVMSYDPSSYGNTKKENDDDDVYMYSVPPHSFPTSHPSLSGSNRVKEEDLTARYSAPPQSFPTSNPSLSDSNRVKEEDLTARYSAPPQSFPTSHPSLSDSNRVKEEDLTARFNYVGTSAGNGTGMFPSTMSEGWKLPFDNSHKVETDSDNDDVYTYDGPQSHRMFPPSMPSFNPVNGPEVFNGFGTQSHPNPNVEKRPLGSDERAIYEEALQNISQETKEEDLPEGVLSISLLKHQRIALAWMLSKENSSHCPGGILADDQGLGKTISTIALIQKERVQQSNFMSARSDSKKYVPLDLDDDDDDTVMAMGKKEPKGEPSDRLDHELCASSPGTVTVMAMGKKELKGEPSDRLDRELCAGSSGTVTVVAMGKKELKGEPSDRLDHELCASSSGTAVKVEPKKKTKVSLPSSASTSRSATRPSAGTLVVCPASILKQWASEIKAKVAESSKLSVLVYHGGSRPTKPTELAKYDVVVTTYTIVGQEVPKQDSDDDMEPNIDEKYGICPDFAAHKKRKLSKYTKKKEIKKKKLSSSVADLDGGPLARVRWFRVVLDEAQTIKNHRTKSARACCGLKAKRRWCLSGTPMQNTIDDLYSYFRFLKYEPYSSFSLFRSMIKGPISRGSSQGYKKLQTVLKIILLRRTKETLLDGEPIIKVPPKTIELKKINFTQEERYFYLTLEEGSRQKFKKFAAAGTIKQNYANILVLLLRLRQACDHPYLLKDDKQANLTDLASIEMAKQLPKEIVTNLLEKLDVRRPICMICKEPPENAVITTCCHIFCYECVLESLSEEEVCPVCKQKLSPELVFSRPVLKLCVSDELESYATTSSAEPDELSSICETSYISSKIQGAVDTLKSIFNIHAPTDGDTLESNPSEIVPKAIVFSQWTGMLDVLELSLNSNFIKFRRLDGSMSLDVRAEAVEEFKTDPEVRVMLMSLKAGNLGLNMIAASHVIMLDPWWNPYAEDQAVDRAHRIGQTRPVTVTRFTVNDTVEDRILALQAKKREMVESAFGEKSGGISTRLTVEDLGYLFNI